MKESGRRTAGRTLIEPEKEHDKAGDDESQSCEVEIRDMFPERPALVRVQVEEEENESRCDASRWSVIDNMSNTV